MPLIYQKQLQGIFHLVVPYGSGVVCDLTWRVQIQPRSYGFFNRMSLGEAHKSPLA